MFDNIDETSLKPEERLGLAYCRMNCFIWDYLFGEKPEGFDNMPETDKGMFSTPKNRRRTKSQYLRPLITIVKRILGEERTSMYWWKFCLNRTYEEWQKWYFVERIKKFI